VVAVGVIAQVGAILVLLVALVLMRAHGRKHRRIRAELSATRARTHLGLTHAAMLRSDIAMFAVDPAGRITWYEGANLTELGLSRATALGRSVWELLEPWPTWVEAVRVALRGGRDIRRVSLGDTALKVSAAPLRDEEACVVEAVVSAWDVSSVDREGERLERLAALRSKSLAAINHHLRAQLSSIIGMTDLLAQTELTDHQREWLALSGASARQLQLYVEHLVDYLELDADPPEPERRPFSLRAALERATARHLARAKSDGTTLLLRYPMEAADRFVGDAARIEQAVALVVGVAVGTNRGGQVVVNVEEERRGDRSRLTIAVEDSGLGLSERALERIFGALESESAMWATRSGASGLELPVAKRIAELLGGDLEARSVSGVGTTLSFSLELERTAALAEGEGDGDGQPELAPLPKARVLLVDDGLDQQLVGRVMLERLGQHVDVAGDGAEAIAALDAEPYDLVLMGLHMPNVGGFEATAAIRARDDARAQVPIVALTADTMPGTRRACIAAGMDGYIAKPLELLALRKMLRQRLGQPLGDEPVDESAVEASVDHAALERLRGLAPEQGGAVVGELVSAFLASAPRQLLAISDAAASGDGEALAAAVGPFRTSCRILGATRMQRLCDAVERAAAGADAEAVRQANAALAAGYQVVKRELAPLAASVAA
jgi:signal transduction histidine kinase/CheY-like chemotaxis protein